MVLPQLAGVRLEVASGQCPPGSGGLPVPALGRHRQEDQGLKLLSDPVFKSRWKELVNKLLAAPIRCM